MSDRKRQLRKLLDRYRDRAAAISLEMPELKALASRHDVGAVAERPAPESPAPAPKGEPEPLFVQAPPDRPMPAVALAPRRPAPADLEAASEPERSYGYAWTAAALMALLAGGGWLFASRLQQRNSHRAYPLTSSSSLGLARRGAVLHSFDRARGQLASFDTGKGEELALKRFPNALASGLAASPDRLWSADANGFLYEHAVADGYAVRRTFANPDRRPSALHWDGSHLWIADARTNSLYEYTVGASLVPSRQFTLPPGMTPVGLHVENGLLWVLDAAGLKVHRYRMRALLEPVDSATLEPWVSAPRRATGMIVDDRVLWISADGTPELHRFDLASLAWRAED